ncbi:uncharacterized protein FOMMEDRAFT_80813 [Fomitiporia mediterranea MF3/22]|uniref:uncharacterized protein n=1 Tax=Fomitiporia mediterranea (strain MF3/22) TaxID=694068 RepID=UPI0004408CAB|nr:uncharacterized protein FOMMEDRAFT_80813 [Fomitiporia mediterranea MF3/22]EJD05292.1 hypothetical protein FOMMEDRAFT_80813 [Fomitiporia mediterranea MF3/22]
MAWPEKVIRQFQTVPQNPNESDFYGPYNKLLYYLFPALRLRLHCCPTIHQSSIRQAPNWVVTFEVLFESRPVFIVELKKPADIQYISRRQTADEQIRERLGNLSAECPISTLHAVSAIGTQLCFYHVDTTNTEAPMIPPRITPRNPNIVTDTAPVEWWDCDIMDAQGEARFCTVVDEIKQACARL